MTLATGDPDSEWSWTSLFVLIILAVVLAVVLGASTLYIFCVKRNSKAHIAQMEQLIGPVKKRVSKACRIANIDQSEIPEMDFLAYFFDIIENWNSWLPTWKSANGISCGCSEEAVPQRQQRAKINALPYKWQNCWRVLWRAMYSEMFFLILEACPRKERANSCYSSKPYEQLEKSRGYWV